MAQQSQHFEDEVAYYYDFHPTEEDLMGETSVHADLVHYLRVVPRFIAGNSFGSSMVRSVRFMTTSISTRRPITKSIPWPRTLR